MTRFIGQKTLTRLFTLPDRINARGSFVKNQDDNIFCANGKIIIEARKERKKNPNYDQNSSDWTKNIEYAEWL